MTGFGMLLKAMGVDIDPAQIGQFIAEAQVQIPAFIARVDAAARKLDQRIARMERNQARLMDKLGVEPEIEPAEPEAQQLKLPGAQSAAA